MRRRTSSRHPGGSIFDNPDLTIQVSGDLAVTWGLEWIFAGGVGSRSRSTGVFGRRNGQWQMMRQHLSIPVTGE